ncbi:RES family NAD+ phosphorylase [Sphingobacterium sp.]|uniref:RES family NAD+ phosphorylase n=1 Tax=Sphingobacterium sp. TaxID=341027 RepID=UPI0031D1A781
MANKIALAFSQFYERTPLEPSAMENYLISDRESNYEWQRHGESVIFVIMDAAVVEEEIANDVQELLEEHFSDRESAEIGLETEFTEQSHYERKILDDRSWQKEWEEFETKLKNETRHFNQFGVKLLNRIFEGIETRQTEEGIKLVTTVGPESNIKTLYRARVFQSNAKLQDALRHPDLQLGPPPNLYALPGRMNARGISMFYGAIEEDIAIGEVRPPVGSKVVVAKFDILKELKLLNLNALTKVNSEGSIFDPNYIRQLERDIFLRKLSDKMSNPVMPEDETMDYLITQAIADYLAVESKVNFDGIMYPSVQSDKEGINIVLFHKSSRVEPYRWELDVNLGSYTEEGWEWDYYVMGKTRKSAPIFRKYYSDLMGEEIIINTDKDSREPTLAIDIQSIRIHHVKAVKFLKDFHNLSFIDDFKNI